jgi:hypothetical protein
MQMPESAGFLRRRLEITCCLLVAGLLGLSLFVSSPALGGSPRVLVPGCPGEQTRYKPARITISCGDGGISVRAIHYESYGGAITHAIGTAEENICQPDCGAGHFRAYPAKLELEAIVDCNGLRYYSRLRYHFSGPAGTGIDPLTPPHCHPDSRSTITVHSATPAELEALTAAAVAYPPAHISTSKDYIGQARVTSNGWAYATLEARNPQEQSNAAFLFHSINGQWKVVEYGDAFAELPGVPRAVLKALGL